MSQRKVIRTFPICFPSVLFLPGMLAVLTLPGSFVQGSQDVARGVISLAFEDNCVGVRCGTCVDGVVSVGGMLFLMLEVVMKVCWCDWLVMVLMVMVRSYWLLC